MIGDGCLADNVWNEERVAQQPLLLVLIAKDDPVPGAAATHAGRAPAAPERWRCRRRGGRNGWHRLRWRCICFLQARETERMLRVEMAVLCETEEAHAVSTRGRKPSRPNASTPSSPPCCAPRRSAAHRASRRAAAGDAAADERHPTAACGAAGCRARAARQGLAQHARADHRAEGIAR